MIKIQANDTIVDIVNKIKDKSNEKEIILEIPFGHPVLHNYLSLKILKSKAEGKRITIITSDISSSKIGKPLGINYSIIKDVDFIKEKNKKQEILKHNFTFLEYLIFEIKKYFKRFIDFIFNSENGTIRYKSPQERIRKSGILFLIIGVVSSISMLLFIFYFAVNRTFVDIIPEIEIETRAINIVYQSPEVQTSIFDDNIIIELREISNSIELTQEYKTSGIDYKTTSRAKGQVKFINELREEQVFRPETRLLTQDGLVFLTDDWVRIPGRTLNGSGETIFGEAIMGVTARLNDNSGNFIGERGNIDGDVIMTIPGLNFNQNNIYAKLIGETSGGKNDVDYFLSEDDLKKAKDNLTERLRKEALDALRNKINEENRQNNVNFDILGINNILNYSDLEIELLEGKKIGDRVDSFKLQGKISISTHIYNKDRVIRILRNLINDSILTGTQKVMFIDESSLRTTEVVERENNPLKVKVTTQIDKGIAFDFDNNSNNYNQRLKMQISGLKKEEAIGILLNDEKIRNVIIRNKPFFLNNVAGNIENIIMRIID